MDADRGVMSGAQKFVQEDMGVTDGQLEVLIGATNIYSLVGSVAAGWTCDRVGRRRAVALSAAMFLAGSAVTAAANGYAALMAGQLVAGVACGFGLVVAPVYIAEIAPARSRGFLSCIPEVRSRRRRRLRHGCRWLLVLANAVVLVVEMIKLIGI
jgi:MFS family permease